MKTRTRSIIILVLIGIAVIIAVASSYTTDQDLPQNGKILPNGNHVYTSVQYNFTLNYPDTLEATTTFSSSYMVGSGWNLYSDPTKNSGMPIISFREKNSNDVLNAELRIGISTSSKDIATCTKVYDTSIIASSTVINGIPFMSFTEGGAAMSHFSNAKSYRIVHNNTCFAIDEFIAGTNPEVYDPPRSLPYNENQAWHDLNEALSTFMFNY